MSRLEEQLRMLRRFNRAVAASDPAIVLESAVAPEVSEEVFAEGVADPDVLDDAITEESIVMRRERPVLAILENKPTLVFEDQVDSDIWKARLVAAQTVLMDAIRAVGRIDLVGARLRWVGTGWLVKPSVLVTNRHVANEFAARQGTAFSFTLGGSGRPIDASVDFLQEIDNERVLRFKLVKPLHIEPAPGPDVAFFQVEPTSGNEKLAKPIELAARPQETESVATIGYPAYDSRIPEIDLMERIYGKKYDKKRVAPGAVTQINKGNILHNCTTLGGNSGSVVLDLKSGEAFGLHFSGSFLVTNYAVRSDVVKKLLDKLTTGALNMARPPPPAPPRARETQVSPPAGSTLAGAASATVTIPLTITVTVGAGSLARAPTRPPALWTVPMESDEPDGTIDDNEAVAEDYRDREGYLPSFLGEGFDVPLPVVTRNPADVLSFDTPDGRDTELRYEHFSVVMSRSRRLCFFSAVNLDGHASRKTKRDGWKWDPRLPKSQQIMAECYGNPPRFSRGHMTRREDPAWGDASSARRGSADSMHVTNATPQMQAFNSPIWLALEDHALQHARDDDMKISIFTGPYFDDEDEPRYGVLIPRSFWKVIAFIHDDTDELCATGYEMNQESMLQPEEEFVFGAFDSVRLGTATQVTIKSIEHKSGLRFGGLAKRDPLAMDAESVDSPKPTGPLLTLQQIRFVA